MRRPSARYFPKNKDWEDIAMGWPLVIVVIMTIVGIYFSNLIVNQIYNYLALAGSFLLGNYLLAAGVIRVKKGKGRFPTRFPFNRKYFLLLIAVPVIFFSSYATIAHGIPALFGSFATKPSEQIVVLVGKGRTGWRLGNRTTLKVSNTTTFPGCALCVSNDLGDTISVGDSVKLTGKRNWFGFYVDQVSKY